MQNRFIKITVIILSISMLLLSGCQQNENEVVNTDKNANTVSETEKATKPNKKSTPSYDVTIAIENSKIYESFRQQMDMSMSMIFDEDVQENFFTKILHSLADMSVSTDISIENYKEDNLAEISMSGLINLKFAGVEQRYEIYIKDGLVYSIDNEMKLFYEKIIEEEMEETTEYVGIKQYLLNDLSIEEAVTSEMTLALGDEEVAVMSYQFFIDTKDLFDMMKDNEMFDVATNPEMGAGSFENALFDDASYIMYVTEDNNVAGIDLELSVIPDKENYTDGVKEVKFIISIRISEQNEVTVIYPDLSKAIEKNN